ncbi:MAG: Glycosyltransferase AglD [Methanonatronarchaeales archaeon]|nr:Glycosyltransferase AglD [Methanonatronarchaeales archaeon]
MISLVLPAHDEVGYLERAVREAEEALSGIGEYEIIIAEDGSTDGTQELAESLESGTVEHLHYDERLGRGEALSRAFEEAGGRYLIYMDVDLATDPRQIEEMVELLGDGADVVTGSRYLPESSASRTPARRLFSKGYNLLVRLGTGSGLRDHQCGFKGFRREALTELLPEVGDDHWFWDTEILVRAQREGLRVEEFPVNWREVGDSKVDPWRDVVGMGTELLRLSWELRVSPRITRRRTVATGLLLTVTALALMGRYIDFGGVASEIRSADPGLLLAAAGVYLASWPVRGWRYREILSRIGYGEGLGFLTAAVFVSQTGNLVFPARAGDGIRAYIVRTRRGIPYPSGFASLAVERVFDLLTITFLAGAVLLYAIASGGGTLDTVFSEVIGAEQRSGRVAVRVAATVGAVAVLSAGAIVASARSERTLLRNVVSRFSEDSYAVRFADQAESFVGDLQVATVDGRSFLRVGGSSLLIWSIDVLTAAMVLAAMGVGLPPGTLLVVCFLAVSVGNLAKVLPLSPGGIGLYEGAFSVIVVALTPVSIPVALGASIVDHALKNLVTVAGGLGSILALDVSLTRAVDAGREAGSTDGRGGANRGPGKL